MKPESMFTQHPFLIEQIKKRNLDPSRSNFSGTAQAMLLNYLDLMAGNCTIEELRLDDEVMQRNARKLRAKEETKQ